MGYIHPGLPLKCCPREFLTKLPTSHGFSPKRSQYSVFYGQKGPRKAGSIKPMNSNKQESEEGLVQGKANFES